MILGVLSDTHGNRAMMDRAARHLLDAHRADVIIHLGDNFDDARALAAWVPEVRAVPGLWCREYRDRSVPVVWTETFAGVPVACAHADHDLAPHASAARIAMHGHTHVAGVVERAGTIWLNPGHLKSDMDRGQRPSYAVVAIAGNALEISVCGLDGATRLRRAYPATVETAEARP